jgi:hypothetical protein
MSLQSKKRAHPVIVAKRQAAVSPKKPLTFPAERADQIEWTSLHGQPLTTQRYADLDPDWQTLTILWLERTRTRHKLGAFSTKTDYPINGTLRRSLTKAISGWIYRRRSRLTARMIRV